MTLQIEANSCWLCVVHFLGGCLCPLKGKAISIGCRRSLLGSFNPTGGGQFMLALHCSFFGRSSLSTQRYRHFCWLCVARFVWRHLCRLFKVQPFLLAAIARFWGRLTLQVGASFCWLCVVRCWVVFVDSVGNYQFLPFFLCSVQLSVCS